MPPKYLEDEKKKLDQPSTYRTGMDHMFDENNEPKPEYNKVLEDRKKQFQPTPKSHWLFNPFESDKDDEDKKANEEVQLKKEHKKAVLNSISKGFGTSGGKKSSLAEAFGRKLGFLDK